MSEILYGAPVAEQMRAELRQRLERLRAGGLQPCLALVRVGEEPGSLSYERSTLRVCEKLGIAVRCEILPPSCDTETLAAALRAVSEDASIHGCLLLRPLPRQIDEARACAALCPEKDVDGATDSSLRRVFVGRGSGFCPCTPEAVLAMLEFYRVPLDGARVCVLGRSLVVGRPLSLLLTARNATVTLCHTHTRDAAALCREADIVVAAAGCAGFVTADYARPGQVVIDVGTSPDAAGKLRGDADFEALSPLVGAISPVPGGVGTITTTLLLRHVIEAAESFS